MTPPSPPNDGPRTPSVADPDTPLDIVYITGTHRSGGTLLGTLLASGAGVFYAGELYRFPFPIFEPGDPTRGCSCGLPVAACPFWTEVRADAESRPGLLSDLRAGQRAYEDWGHLPSTLLRYLRKDPAIDRFMARTEEFNRIVATRSRSKVIVESSFSPLRGLLYRRARLGGGKVRYIHLVRDGRSFFRSETGPIGGPVEFGPAWQRSPPAVVARWLVFHLASIAFCSRGPKTYLRVRYEDLLLRPSETVRSIQQFLGIDYSEAIRRIETEQAFPMVHLCAANRSRLKGSLVVHPEMATPPRLSRAHTALFWGMAGWLALAFGYRPGTAKTASSSPPPA